MAATRLLMRRLRELLRLKYAVGLTHRAIAQACAVGLGTVSEYLTRVTAAGLHWPLPDDLDDAALEARVFARPIDPARLDQALPAWSQVHQELKRPGVTLQLLWLEYRAVHPTGYAYSHFCARYRAWARTLKPSMRQVHRAGEKLFVDFSGKRPSLVDATTGELVRVELFVGVLGASGLIYAEATRSQELPAWVGAHVHMIEYFGGSHAIWVPDNLKSGVTTSNYYEPEINRTYAELARHYGAIVLPARAAHPKDKPKAEVSVQIAQRWILAVMRRQTFFHPRGLECRDPHVPRRGQCPADANRGRQSAGALRAARSARAPPAAAQPVRAGDVEAVSREYRLSRRGRAQLVQRAVSTGPRARRGARRDDDGRSVVHRPTGRVARAAERSRPLLDAGRAHAAGASRPRGMDALTADRVGRPDGPRDGTSRRRHS